MMTILSVLLLGLLVPNSCFAADSSYTYWLRSDGSNRYELTVSVTSSLYEYYQSKDHRVNSYEFAKFVTPYALKPVADSLWSIYNDDEDFANGVLTITHQIPYEESAPQKYPVETIVENEGDCDLFSFIAASVMIAGGLDVVLLYYEEQSHMNVGVNLSHEPNDARSTISYFTFEDKRYYMAETTGDNLENGWRVGECPDLLKRATANIITLEAAEQLSPGQVSASYRGLSASSITLSLSSTLILEDNNVIISGSITPSHSNQDVTIYARGAGDSEWTVLETLSTDSIGHYSYVWSPNSAKTQYISASWSGDTDHAGANSNIQTLIIIPLNWVLVTIISIVSVIMATVIFVAFRHRNIPEEGRIIRGEN
jgi:hypothetical protein